jgi:predicted hydrocarbon binding protein
VDVESLGAGDQVTPPTNPILAELTHEPGVLSYRGARYLLIRPETLAALQRAVDAALGAGAAECFASGGRAGGGRAVDQLASDVERRRAEPPARERVERLLAMGSAIGWGEFALEALTTSALVVTVRRSPFAEAYGAASAPVCHLTRGVLEALTASLFGARWTVREVRCAASGASLCRFEATPERATGA